MKNNIFMTQTMDTFDLKKQTFLRREGSVKVIEAVRKAKEHEKKKREKFAEEYETLTHKLTEIEDKCIFYKLK